MSRRASGFIVAALVLVAALGAGVASASKAVTPEFGLFYGQVVGPEEGGSVSVRETEVKVVKTGKGRGAELRVSAFQATCDGGLKGQPFGLGVLEKSPIPINGDGKFALDRTTHGPVAAGAGTATTRTVVSGTFKSATKVVVKVSVKSSVSIQYPEQPEVKGTCTGKQTTTAKHQ